MSLRRLRTTHASRRSYFLPSAQVLTLTLALALGLALALALTLTLTRRSYPRPRPSPSPSPSPNPNPNPHRPNQVRLYKLPTEAAGGTFKACSQGGLCVLTAGTGAGAVAGCTAARHKSAAKACHAATPPNRHAATPPYHATMPRRCPVPLPSLLTRRASIPGPVVQDGNIIPNLNP